MGASHILAEDLELAVLEICVRDLERMSKKEQEQAVDGISCAQISSERQINMATSIQ